MVLVQLSGEEHWLDEMAPFIDGPWDYSVSMPAELAARAAEAGLAGSAAVHRHVPFRLTLERAR
jgi:hypothetical protein